MKDPLPEFWRRNHVALLYLPLLVAVCVVTYSTIREIEPRIGLEGFGDLFGYVLNGVRVAMIIFCAFWFKHWALFDLHKPTELELFEASRDGSYAAEKILWRDRLEWAFLLVFFGWAFTQ